MKIIRGRLSEQSSQLRSDTFTGEVWMDPVVERADGVMVNSVFFAPRSRTHWHRHEHGQVLYVTSGAGRAYTRDGEGGPIGVGDTIHIPPGEEHWHGAAERSYVVHLAISLGETEWLEPVTDEEYAHPGA